MYLNYMFLLHILIAYLSIVQSVALFIINYTALLHDVIYNLI